MTDPGRAKRRLLGLARLAAVLVAAGVFAVLLTESLQNNDAYASIFSGVAAVVTLFIGLFDHLRRQDAMPPLDEVVEDLRIRLLDEYAPELHRRVQRFSHEKTIPLEWKKYGGSGDPSPLDGRFEGDPDEAAKHLAERFDQRSGKKRMVVLGEPGAGKTFIALALAVGLLHRWKNDKLIAVYLSLSAWDPVVDTLDKWMVDTIAKSYYFGERRRPSALLTDQRLVPVLDGLDELPEHLRRRAVQRINESLTGDRMLVVTCRTTEYEDVLMGGAPVLLRAPAVEVRPVTPKDVLGRLKEVPAWADVVHHVKSRPNGPLATALSTPLMLSLFTASYLERDPAQLLDPTKFASRHAVEHHLVDLKLDTAYPERAPRGQWNAKQARRWLIFLAQHMHENDDRDITWRKLAHRSISTTTQLVLAFTLSSGLLWLGTLHVDQRTSGSDHATSALFDSSPLVSLVLGALLAAIWLAWRRPETPVEPGNNSLVTGFKRGATIGMTVVVVPGFLLWLLSTADVDYYRMVANSAMTAEVLALAVVCGAAIGLHEMMVDRTTAHLTTRPTSDGLKQERRSTLLASAAAGLMVGTLSIPAAALATSVGSHLGQRLAASRGYPAVADLELPPLMTYVHWPLTPGGIVRLAEVSVLIALVFAVELAATRAWSRLLTARVKLASTGRVPWRLRRFLTDATERGLLRRVGAAHQFGHALLQERLVSTAVTHAPVRHRKRVRIAAAGVAVVLVASLAFAAWSGRPADCRDTTWPQINNRVARATLGPDTACFAVFERSDHAGLQRDETDAPALAALTATEPDTADLPLLNRRSMVIIGEFDRFSATRWHDILSGLASAKQVTSRVNAIRFVYADLEMSEGREAARLIDWYLEWAYFRDDLRGVGYDFAAVSLDTASSIAEAAERAPALVIGLDNTELRGLADEFSDNLKRDWVATLNPALAVDALVDGVSADDCAALRKDQGRTLKFDLTRTEVTPKLLNDIAACGPTTVLVKPEDAATLAKVLRPAEVEIRYVHDRSETIVPDCTRALGESPSADSLKACVAAMAAVESFRIAIEEVPGPVQR